MEEKKNEEIEVEKKKDEGQSQVINQPILSITTIFIYKYFIRNIMKPI